MLPESIDRELVDVYRAWNAIEKAQYKNSVIDFDLAPRRFFAPLEDRRDVLNRLEELLQSLEGVQTNIASLARSRITASITYLQALMGHKFRFDDYVRRTLGVEARQFSESEIKKQREVVTDRLMQEYEIGFTANEISRFRAKTMIYNKKELPLEFERFRQLWIPVLLEKIFVPIEKYNILVRFASEDAYWKNWISGNLSAHEILLRINIHPRQSWYQGFPELLVIHEYCGHAVQMVNWHVRIENGILPQFCGILTVHFPDQFVLEGLAESLAFVLPGKQRLRPQSIVSRELHRYYLIVMNNVHIIANEQDLNAAMDYASHRLPFTPTEVLSREVEDRTNNPLFRGYQYAYGIAKESFLGHMNNFSDQGRWDLLRRVYNWPMTPSQFQQTARDLANKLEIPS